MTNIYEYEVVVRRIDGNEIACEDKKIIDDLDNNLWEASCVISGISKSINAERNTSVFIIGHVKVEETDNEDNFESIIDSIINDFINEYPNMQVTYRKNIIENNKKIYVGEVKHKSILS